MLNQLKNLKHQAFEATFHWSPQSRISEIKNSLNEKKILQTFQNRLQIAIKPPQVCGKKNLKIEHLEITSLHCELFKSKKKYSLTIVEN